MDISIRGYYTLYLKICALGSRRPMRLGVLDAFTNTVSKNAKHPMESCI